MTSPTSFRRNEDVIIASLLRYVSVGNELTCHIKCVVPADGPMLVTDDTGIDPIIVHDRCVQHQGPRLRLDLKGGKRKWNPFQKPFQILLKLSFAIIQMLVESMKPNEAPLDWVIIIGSGNGLAPKGG